jgi:hypothetical protein
MNKTEKENLLKTLRENEAYKQSLGAVKSEDDRRRIKAFAEDFYLKFLEGMLNVQKVVVEHPDEVAEASHRAISKD